MFENKKDLVVVLVLIFILILILGNGFTDKSSLSELVSTCGDSSFYNTCSLIKPYFCDNGVLIEKASVCGCNDLFRKQGDFCVSEYQTESKEVNLKYILDGEENEIEFILYKGVNDYVANLSKEINYFEDEEPSRADFKLKSINEEQQREMLLPLVMEIQNLADNDEDQFRIAVSLVQNIPYGYSNKTTNFFGREINASRYPYEVLYDNQGICGEKSQLLAFLLREIGYGVSFFYHSVENHESLGVACPVEESFDNTGYCFIETTAPSIITDDSIVYASGITLVSEPEIFLLSPGKALPENMGEYKDANKMKKMRNNLFVLFKNHRMNNLIEKYGLVEEYYLE